MLPPAAILDKPRVPALRRVTFPQETPLPSQSSGSSEAALHVDDGPARGRPAEKVARSLQVRDSETSDEVPKKKRKTDREKEAKAGNEAKNPKKDDVKDDGSPTKDKKAKTAKKANNRSRKKDKKAKTAKKADDGSPTNDIKAKKDKKGKHRDGSQSHDDDDRERLPKATPRRGSMSEPPVPKAKSESSPAKNKSIIQQLMMFKKDHVYTTGQAASLLRNIESAKDKSYKWFWAKTKHTQDPIVDALEAAQHMDDFGTDLLSLEPKNFKKKYSNATKLEELFS